ncbi:MAG: hypothetical protein QXN59_02715, partial [Candidatus Micrarchaeaceae archaeon]
AINEVDSLSYALSSDLKAATILAMKPSKEYSREELAEEVSEFLGNCVKVSPETVANYFARWHSNIRPVNVKREHSRKGNVEWITMRKEKWAECIYDPIIIKAMETVLRLGAKMGKELTLSDVFGPSSTPGAYSKGANIYTITKTLVSSDKNYTYKGLVKKIAESYGITARHQIRVMADIGLIDYSSIRPRGTEAHREWSRYIKMREIKTEEAVSRLIESKPYLNKIIPSIERVVCSINRADGWIDPRKISKESGVQLGGCMKIMANLCKAGFLGRRESGGYEISIVKANNNTISLWDGALWHMGELAWFMHSYVGQWGRAPETVEWLVAGKPNDNEAAISAKLAKIYVARRFGRNQPFSAV